MKLTDTKNYQRASHFKMGWEANRPQPGIANTPSSVLGKVKSPNKTIEATSN